jgi:RNA ligase
MLEIQKFLARTGRYAVHQEDSANLSALASPPYSLNVKRHSKFENLVHFSYDQIDSPRSGPIIEEARGLILDQEDEWKIVAFPFKRFFNEGEGHAATIDWTTARVQEKMDGSLLIMYWYADRWRVATRGLPDASGQVSDYKYHEKGVLIPMTFEKLFWSSCEFWLKGLSKSGDFDKNCTYMWELTSPANRVVCDYTKTAPMMTKNEDGKIEVWEDELIDDTGYAHDGSRLTLIGARNNVTLEEHTMDRYRGDVWYVVQEFPFNSVESVIEAASKINPLRQEGFVVVDANFNRIKIKSPAYVAIHHLRDGAPRRRLIDLLKSGEGPEALAYSILDDFPAEKGMFLAIQEKVLWLTLLLEGEYAKIKEIENRKEFALEAIKTPLSSALFALRDGKVRSMKQFLMAMPSDKLLDLIDRI